MLPQCRLFRSRLGTHLCCHNPLLLLHRLRPKFNSYGSSLKQCIQSLRSLIKSDEDEKQGAIKAGRTHEVSAPVTAVVEDELLAKQWMMRYSEDNVTLASFELPHLISMVLGMPIMVATVASTKN